MPSFTDTLTVNGESMEMYARRPLPAPAPHSRRGHRLSTLAGVDEFDKGYGRPAGPKKGYVAVVPDLFHRFTDEQLNGPPPGNASTTSATPTSSPT